MYQICYITAAVKKALKEKAALSYTPFKYENKIEFQFLPEKKLFNTKKYKSENTSSWYEYCLEKGLQDVKFLAPVAVQDRSVLGFSNTTQSSIVCFYEGSKVTYFTASWGFDSLQKVWDILYVEQEWDNAPNEKPHFENNTESFKIVLSEIREFAQKIDCNNFAKVFKKIP